MGRRFAGILALTGTTVVLLQGVRRGGSFDSIVLSAACWTAALAAAGWLIGVIANQTVDEAVKTRLESELAAATAANEPAAAVEPSN